jgi:restriction endonuclease S subunit
MAVTNTKNLSELEGPKRIDGEYYQRHFLEAKEAIMRLPTKSLRQMSESVLSFGAYSLCNFIVWQESGIPYLKAENIREGYIDFSGTMFIDGDVHNILWKSQVRERQILLSMSGTTGNAAVAHNIPLLMNSNQDIAKITLKPMYSPYYVACFINSKYGRLQTEREIVGSVQQHVFLNQIKRLRVPLVSEDMEDEIERIYRQGLDEREHSNNLYLEAENLIYEKIGLADFHPDYVLSYSSNLSESFKAHRIDAEFFQPLYSEMAKYIISKDYYIVNQIKEFNKRGVQPIYVEDGEISVITSKRLGSMSIDYENLERTTSEEWKRNTRAQIRHHDILIYTTGANVGRTNCYLEEDRAIASNHINILRVNVLNPIYVAVFLNSILGQLQVKRFITGSAQAELYPSDIAKFVIWNAPERVQNRVASLVLESHGAKKKAGELLRQAIMKVEEAIEAEISP